MPVKENVLNEQSINDVNYEQLKKLFPHAVSIDDDGKYIIDPQKLQMSLDPSKADIKEDGYGLNWVGKKEAYHQAFSKNYKVLKPLNNENSKNWDETGNILIKGDNLDALKILRQNYFESIKMIYIDPPYNTENDEFVYNDNFTANTKETLEALGYEKEYVDYIENIQGAKTHSGWLSFMYPRLLLAKDLLKDDGVIFISIDEHEVAQLKILCDEVFGDSNGDILIWRKNGKQGNTKKILRFKNTHEYVLVYFKNKTSTTIGKVNLRPNWKGKKTNVDNDSRGKWESGIICLHEDKSNKESANYYSIKLPSGRVLTREFYITKECFETFKKENKIYFPKNGDGIPRLKIFENEEQSYYFDSIIDEMGTFTETKDMMKNILGNREIFDTPKPLKMIKEAVRSSSDKNSLILDFFAGSGTTAHAVMKLNAEDGGNRRCISVQIPELIDSGKNKAAYEFIEKTLNKDIEKEPPTIFDITQERIKRAGDQIAEGDIGFRAFEIIEDTKQHIYQKSLEEMNQSDLLTLMENTTLSSNEDILYNLLVAEGLVLSLSIKTLVADKLYLASNVAFVLADISIDALLEALKDKKELEYITVYSPNISDDKFTLELESAVGNIGIKPDKLRFRG